MAAIAASAGGVEALSSFECGGTLWLHDDYGAQRFRCRVGHSFSTDGLLPGKRTALERTLWAAVAALEEWAGLSRRIMKRLEDSGRAQRLDRYREDLAVAKERAGLLRDLIRDLVHETSITYDETDDGAGAGATA